jgi:DNA-binding LacI/PurR family transcriptional regulator
MPLSVTLKAVAARAGVSYQTVSKVLNGQLKVSPETERRILEASQALGYRPNHIARNMRLQRSHMIGYSWVPTSANQVNHILDGFLSSMVQEAEAAGFHLLPFPYRDGDALVEPYRDLIDTGRVDGFVLSSVNYNDPRIHFLLERGFPFVAFGRSDPQLDFPYVDVDGGAGMRQAAEHLIARGHVRIAVIGWPPESRVGNDRLDGFFTTLHKAGLSIRPEWVQRGEGSFEYGYAAATHLLENLERPTAIVALNDTQAIGALHAARVKGLEVGRDIAIIGFDDAPMAQYLIPPLTSIRQPIREAGRKCVEILVRLMANDEPKERQVLLVPQLIVRDSG